MGRTMTFEGLKKTIYREACKFGFNNFSDMIAMFTHSYLNGELLDVVKRNNEWSLHDTFKKEREGMIKQLIDRLDIRSIDMLSDNLKMVLPLWVRNGQYSCKLGDNGWILVEN